MEKKVMPRGYWTKERVFEEGRKYRTKSEFQKGSKGAYKAARRNNWLSTEMDWFEETIKPNGYWTKELVFSEAIKYQTKKEFRLSNPKAYEAAYRNKWVEEMDWFISSQNPITDPIYSVYCYRFKEYNAIYIGLSMRLDQRKWSHANRNDSPVYRFAHEHGIEVPDIEILIEGLCQKEAQLYEDKLRKVSNYMGINTINTAPTGVGVGSLGSGIKKWYKKAVFNEAMKYNTKKEFYTNSPSAYRVASTNGWISDMTFLEAKYKPDGYWTNERVIEEAKKYSTRTKFSDGCSTAYKVAIRLGIIDQLFPKKNNT